MNVLSDGEQRILSYIREVGENGTCKYIDAEKYFTQNGLYLGDFNQAIKSLERSEIIKLWPIGMITLI